MAVSAYRLGIADHVGVHIELPRECRRDRLDMRASLMSATKSTSCVARGIPKTELASEPPTP
jgi:hypothetical protein